MLYTILMSDNWLSVTQVATELRRSKADVRRMIGDGRLPAHKFGKRSYSVRRTDLDLFIAKSMVGDHDPLKVFLLSELASSDPAAREAARTLLAKMS